MNTKPKILFYGNCHMSAISQYFADNLNNELDIISCTECGLEPQWPNSPSYAIWIKQNSGPNWDKSKQHAYYPCIHEKLKSTDIFVFQDFSGKSAIDKLQTEYLHNEILPKNAIKICLPDFRFFLNVNDPISITPWVKYAKTKTSNSKEIIDFLQNSDDPHLVELFQNEAPYNKEYVKYRGENYSRYEEETEKYDIRINMNDWIEENFENQIITHQHNHPTEIYFKEIISRIFKYININENQFPIENVGHPKANNFDPQQFKFFRTQFPNMDYSQLSNRREITINDLTL